VLVFLLLSLVVFYRLTYSRIGRACKAIEESDLLSECTGISAMRYKMMAFTISSWFAAMVGALHAHYIHFIGPQQFGFWNSVEYIVFVIIGGVGTFVGPIIGAAFLTFLPEFLRIAETWEVAIYGLALMLTILFMPHGIRGFAAEVISKLSKSELKAST
jgi:branched-chain amino acid transport system permease protein